VRHRLLRDAKRFGELYLRDAERLAAFGDAPAELRVERDLLGSHNDLGLLRKNGSKSTSAVEERRRVHFPESASSHAIDHVDGACWCGDEDAVVAGQIEEVAVAGGDEVGACSDGRSEHVVVVGIE